MVNDVGLNGFDIGREITPSHSQPPARRGNGTPTKGRWGYGQRCRPQWFRHRPKISLLNPNPPARRGNGPPTKGRWGYGQRCRPQWFRHRPKISLLNPNPPRGEETGLRQKD